MNGPVNIARVEATPGYAEIGITTNFSFLRGGSDPRAYVHQASELGISAIGIADHNTLAGVVRAYKELDNPEVKHKPKLLIGARLVFIDGTPDILVYPRDRAAYGRLCQLLTRGKRGDDIQRIEKGECHLRFDDLLEFAEGQLLVLALPHRFDVASAQKILERLKNASADGVWLAASLLYRGDDKRRLARLHRMALAAKVPLLATNEVLYHHPARRPLQDVLTCIREKTTIDAIGKRLEANAERYLKPGREMARLFRDIPQAVAETMRFAGRISFSLDQLKYQYPDEPVPPGKTAQQHLEDLTWAGVDKYFGGDDLRDAARHLAQGTRADRRAQIRALFSDRARHRPLCAQPEHPLPGPGVGGELRGLLRARHHLGRSDQGRSACSSASSPRSGWSRPTSTSISNIRGARR